MGKIYAFIVAIIQNAYTFRRMKLSLWASVNTVSSSDGSQCGQEGRDTVTEAKATLDRPTRNGERGRM